MWSLLNTRLSTAVFCLNTCLSFHELQRKSLHIIPVTSEVHQTQSPQPPLNMVCSVLSLRCSFSAHCQSQTSPPFHTAASALLVYQLLQQTGKHLLALSPHNLLTASRTSADSREGTDRPYVARHAASYRTESEAGSPECSHFASKRNASTRLSGPCDAKRRDAAREGIRYHANSRACVVVLSAVFLLLCVNKHADDDCPSGSQQTLCETLPKTNFKGRTLKYSKEKSVIWNKTPYVNLNAE